MRLHGRVGEALEPEALPVAAVAPAGHRLAVVDVDEVARVREEEGVVAVAEGREGLVVRARALEERVLLPVAAVGPAREERRLVASMWEE